MSVSGFISGFNYDRGKLLPTGRQDFDYKFRDGAKMLERVSNSQNKVFLATGGLLVDTKSGVPGVFFSGGFLSFGDHIPFDPVVGTSSADAGGDRFVISTGGWDIHTVVSPRNFDAPNDSEHFKFSTIIGGESSQNLARDIQLGFHGSQGKIYVEDASTAFLEYPDASGNIDLEDTVYLAGFSGPSGTSSAGNGQFGLRVNNGSYLTKQSNAAGDYHLIQNLGGSFFASIPLYTGIISEAIIISGLLTDTERDEIKQNILQNFGVCKPYDENAYSDGEVTKKTKQDIGKKFSQNSFLFSVRKLNPDYIGPAMRVRRQSDDQMADVYFDNNNIISSGSKITLYPNYKTESLTGFISGTKDNLYVDTWFDQGYVEEFTPVYNSSIKFNASNSQWYGGNSNLHLMPNGVNNITSSMDLDFVGSKAKIQKIISYIEEVTRPNQGSGVSSEITGQESLYQSNDTVNFGRLKSKFRINLDNTFYNDFEGSQVAGFTTSVLANNVYNLKLKLINNKVSPFLNLGEGFVKKSFSPEHIPGLGFWIDAADTGTIITGANADFNNNHKVQGVIDKVSRLTGDVSTQTKVGYGGSGRNGLNLLNGSGAATTAITFPFFKTNSGEFEAFCVVREENTANERVGFFGDADFTNGGFMFNVDGASRRTNFVVNSESSQESITGGVLTPGQFELMNGFVNTGKLMKLTSNGDETNSQTLSSSEFPLGKSTKTFTIFDGPQGGHAEDFGGWFAEGLVYDRALTDTERSQVTKYLTNKWHLSHAANVNYQKFDVVKVPGAHTGHGRNNFDNYFYMTADRAGSISSDDVRGLTTYTGIGDNATRTFFWDPDEAVTLNKDYSQRTLNLGSSFTQILNIEKNQNNLQNLDLSFSNRTDKEAYSILHFLESHLGYKQFVYYMKDELINQKKVFYCDSWSHDFIYKDSNTIKAKFIEIANPIMPTVGS